MDNHKWERLDTIGSGLDTRVRLVCKVCGVGVTTALKPGKTPGEGA